MLTVNRKIPPSKGDPSGPVICARIDVMSDGSGAYAATPGGGSFCSKDISRINRALEAMVLLVGWLEIEARSEEGMKFEVKVSELDGMSIFWWYNR